MFVSRKTIDEVYDLSLEKVIGRFADLKKAGASWKGCCPFHDEKTASFVVTPAKSMYHCFGCGKHGKNVVTFLMEKDGLDWIEAVKTLAQMNGIYVEYEESAESEKYQAAQVKQQSLSQINAWAVEFYQHQLGKAPAGALRCKPETAELFELGYAPAAWSTLADAGRKAGHSIDLLTELYLVKKAENVYDVFRDRILFPIYNFRGIPVGFSGRFVGLKEDKKTPKYMNTGETPLYNKSEQLYGLHIAKDAIRKKGFAYLVEGNWDVIANYEAGLENTVAPCGTALTREQLRVLKKITGKIVMMYDGDKAGRAACRKNLLIAIEEGFTVECLFLPDGQDPDSFLSRRPDSLYGCWTGWNPVEFEEYFEDAVMWLATTLFGEARNKPEEATAQATIESMLSYLEEDRLIENYCEDLGKLLKIKTASLKRNAFKLKEVRDGDTVEGGTAPLPKGVNREQFEEDGYFELILEKEKKAGYYNYNSRKETYEPFSNFVIKPLYHIYSKMDNKRLVELNNGRYKVLLDLPSKALVGIQLFKEIIVCEGNYRFDGSAGLLQKVIANILGKFPRCEELKTLGWQHEGFYAFSDGIFSSDWINVDGYGVVAHKDKHYFLPAFSSIYADVREEDDMYENDRWFKFHQVKENNFEKWAELMIKAYGNKNGSFAVAFLVASLFRDMIYSKYKIFPHLFLFGEKGSGKSQLGWSLNNVFWNGQPGFNLTSGTNVGFFRKLARARNSIVWFDEYNDYIDPKRFQALKSAYDGIGHEKGVMSRDSRTESTKVNSSSVISGQWLPTLDDNALFTRSILLNFHKADWQGHDHVMKAYSTLKSMEENGLGVVITDVIKYRDLMEQKYAATFQAEFTKMKDDIGDCNDRILRNFVTVISVVKVLEEVLKFPFDYAYIYKVSKAMISEQSHQISESEALSQFWNMIEFLFRDKRINWDGSTRKETDFKVETVNSVKIKKNNKEDVVHNFDKPTKCLFVRFSKIHPLYLEKHRQQHGVNGMAMSSLQTYIRGHKAFVGTAKSIGFDDGFSSAYTFIYEDLNVSLEFNPPDPIAKPEGEEQPKAQPKEKQGELEIPNNDDDGQPF